VLEGKFQSLIGSLKTFLPQLKAEFTKSCFNPL